MSDKSQVSKAPPPITPLRGGASYSPPENVAKAPDWDFWRAMRKVNEQQACALSLNIDPDSGQSFPIKESNEKFDKRLRLLRANRYDREIFTLPMTKHSGLGPNEIYLSEFAAWGLSLGWGDMPQELAAMAQGQAVIVPTAEPPLQSRTHERFARLRFRELWSEGELQSIMCGDAGRLFGSGHSATDSEQEDARGAIWDGVTVESLIASDWRQVESRELMESPEMERYFKPEQAIAWVNRDRFPKFPFPASEVAPTVDALPLSPAANATAKAANNWDAHGLQRLLSESREPGMTQKKLAEQYKVSRQRIAILLNDAKPTRASPFDSLKLRNGKK